MIRGPGYSAGWAKRRGPVCSTWRSILSFVQIQRCITQPTLTSAAPGDLSFVLPYRHLQSIIEMLEAMDRITPGIFSRHTLLYGVEVKFYTNRVKISPVLETGVQNLFLIGDGAGITRGLMQASISGMLAAEEILRRIKMPKIRNA